MAKSYKTNDRSKKSREEEMVTHPFDNIWAQWLKEGNLEQKIKDHLEQREKFLKFMKKILAKKLEKGAKILEIGAGTAIDSSHLAKEFPYLKFYGTDISQGSIDLGKKIAKRMNAEIDLVLDDATVSRFPDETFDLIFSQGVVEHFTDPSAIMSEQVRTLKKGGYLIIDVPQKFNPYTIYKHRRIDKGKWPYGWETEYSLWDLRRLGKKYGLKPLGSIGYGYGVGEDYNFYLISTFGERLRRKVPWLSFLGKAYTKVMRKTEEKFGAFFMLSVVVEFKK